MEAATVVEAEKEREATEEVAEEVAEATAPAKKNRIQVSTNKKPLYFYVNLAKVSISLSLFCSLDCIIA